jgi:UDP-glucuronate 4-epimerase
MQRDFTYVDDIVEGVVRVTDRIATPQSGSVPYRIFNIGNNRPALLLHFIACVEKALGMPAKMNFLPLQPGDVPATYASTQALHDWVGFVPDTPMERGVSRFVAWYRDYHRVQTALCSD